MTDQEKEEYAAGLAKKAESAVKVLKVLAIGTVAVAVVLFIFLLAAVPALGDKPVVIGFAVGMACVLALLVIGVFAVIVYAYITLNKLKKLK